MIVIGIESSCDDTSVALVTDEGAILSNVISSQGEIHTQYGGIVPEIAARNHIDNIDMVFQQALKESKCSIKDISAIAGTCGPGLIGGLIVGSIFARTLAVSLSKPFYAINHLEAHALSARMFFPQIEFPYLLLLTSGGHCNISIVHGIKEFTLLGETLDDSAGEAFDKVAKMLNLKYPGGPEIEKLAQKGNENRFDFPRPLYNKNECDMSFSGLKTAVKTTINGMDLSEQDICDICASFQKSVFDVLVQKCSYAARKDNNVTALIAAGGVAANKTLKERLMKEVSLPFFSPPANICTDNAAMIAWNAIERIKLGDKGDGVDFKPAPRWPMGTKPELV